MHLMSSFVDGGLRSAFPKRSNLSFATGVVHSLFGICLCHGGSACLCNVIDELGYSGIKLVLVQCVQGATRESRQYFDQTIT